MTVHPVPPCAVGLAQWELPTLEQGVSHWLGATVCGLPFLLSLPGCFETLGTSHLGSDPSEVIHAHLCPTVFPGRGRPEGKGSGWHQTLKGLIGSVPMVLQLKQMEVQLEEEYEDKQKVLREKRELESKLTTLSDQVSKECCLGPGQLPTPSSLRDENLRHRKLATRGRCAGLCRSHVITCGMGAITIHCTC